MEFHGICAPTDKCMFMTVTYSWTLNAFLIGGWTFKNRYSSNPTTFSFTGGVLRSTIDSSSWQDIPVAASSEFNVQLLQSTHATPWLATWDDTPINGLGVIDQNRINSNYLGVVPDPCAMKLTAKTDSEMIAGKQREFTHNKLGSPPSNFKIFF